MSGLIGIDADGMIYKTYTKGHVEASYIALFRYIEYILYRSKLGKKQKYMLLFSPEETFRNRLLEYKQNRPARPTEILQIKDLVLQRMPELAFRHDYVEADDLAVNMSRQGMVVMAVDKDVLMANETLAFNWQTCQWVEPKTKLEIEEWYVSQTIMGDGADGFKGVEGKGAVFAKNFVETRPSYDEWVNLFTSEQEAIDTMRLVRMDQYSSDKGLWLWRPDSWNLNKL